jgi:hypothetical protein
LGVLGYSGCRTLRGFRRVRVKNTGILIVGLPKIAILALTDFIGECSTAKGLATRLTLAHASNPAKSAAPTLK